MMILVIIVATFFADTRQVKVSSQVYVHSTGRGRSVSVENTRLIPGSTVIKVVSRPEKTEVLANGKQVKNVICLQPAEVGPCKAAFHRCYFDANTQKCEGFIYGGCRGNENNFRSRQECEAACIGNDESNPPHVIDTPKKAHVDYEASPLSQNLERDDVCICTANYNPFCCDGVQYGNRCNAVCELGKEVVRSICKRGECQKLQLVKEKETEKEVGKEIIDDSCDENICGNQMQDKIVEAAEEDKDDDEEEDEGSSSSSLQKLDDDSCIDKPPLDGKSCEDHKGWGSCEQSWTKDQHICDKTCGRC